MVNCQTFKVGFLTAAGTGSHDLRCCLFVHGKKIISLYGVNIILTQLSTLHPTQLVSCPHLVGKWFHFMCSVNNQRGTNFLKERKSGVKWILPFPYHNAASCGLQNWSMRKSDLIFFFVFEMKNEMKHFLVWRKMVHPILQETHFPLLFSYIYYSNCI